MFPCQPYDYEEDVRKEPVGKLAHPAEEGEQDCHLKGVEQECRNCPWRGSKPYPIGGYEVPDKKTCVCNMKEMLLAVIVCYLLRSKQRDERHKGNKTAMGYNVRYGEKYGTCQCKEPNLYIYLTFLGHLCSF